MLKQGLLVQFINLTGPEGKMKKVIVLMKKELGGEIMKEFAALKAKTYSYLTES